MNESLRTSAAHIIVDSIHQPELSDVARHHLSRVLRLRDGERITCTDGAGSWVEATWTSGDARVVGEVHSEPVPEPRLTVAVTPLKGDNTDLVIEKLVEVGIDRIIVLAPLDRSVVRWKSDKVDNVLDRYRRIVQAAVMQSRRVFVPEIDGLVSLSGLAGPGVAYAEPGGRGDVGEVTTLVIGPEGGFSPEELSAAPTTLDIGPFILRAETAAIVGAARLVAHWRR